MNIFRTLSLPDVFSLLNALFGFAAVIMIVGRGPTYIPILFVLLAAAADGLDGFLARRLRISVLGSNLDSLADLVSFGMAPAVLAVASFGSGSGQVMKIVAGIYLTCGVLRLARFNTSPKSDKFFEGLPITASGIIVSISILLNSMLFTLLLTLVLSALMVSGIQYPKVRDYRIVSALMLIIIAAAYLSFNGSRHSIILIFIALVGYLLSPVVISFLRRRR